VAESGKELPKDELGEPELAELDELQTYIGRKKELEKSKIWINAPGEGRKPILTPSEETGLCLFYLKTQLLVVLKLKILSISLDANNWLIMKQRK
jgi:hypothetical protein